jgi:hypothetical protein
MILGVHKARHHLAQPTRAGAADASGATRVTSLPGPPPEAAPTAATPAERDGDQGFVIECFS